LNKVKAQKERGADVNGDGLHNCIDASVLFYQYFPDKNKVCIEANDKMSPPHLFNCVLIDGTWRAVEPQAYWKGHNLYFMRDVWGEEYTSVASNNHDVTHEYRRYVK
jgi:hypothetical protein